MQWSFWDPKTGEFEGRKFHGPEELAKLNAHGAEVIAGEFDHLSQRVDLTTLEVVNFRPDAPDDDHEWDDKTRRWRKRLDLLLADSEARKAREAIAEIEKTAGPRPVREALLKLLPDGPEKDRLAAFEVEVVTHRAAINAKSG